MQFQSTILFFDSTLSILNVLRTAIGYLWSKDNAQNDAQGL